jgi:transcriptional regulator with XRE-family HTH domain
MMETKISKHIQILRVKHDLSQRQLAAKSGISQRVISAMEDAKSLTVLNLEAVAQAFGLTLSELFKGAEALNLGEDTDTGAA